MKVVIRAGGTGTRLWPLSRRTNPKQFLPVFESGRSCVQEACHRFMDAGLVRPGDIFVSVGAEHESLARRRLPGLPESNFIIEPAKMDTAAAVALETVIVAGDDPDTVIASLGSDHYVESPAVFVDSLKNARRFLTDHPDRLLTIACEPVRVETGYGHVKKGDKIGDYNGQSFFEVEEFTEKPDYPTARRYTESGQYLWNANFFAWTAGALMNQFREFEPQMHEAFMKILQARGTSQLEDRIREIYPKVKKIAIDYAVLEPAADRGRLAVLPVSMGWSDIGSWASITDAFPPDHDGNLFRAPVFAVDTAGCTVFGEHAGRRLIALVGVENLAVIDTGDALLIVPKERAGQVKELVGRLEEHTEFRALT